MKHILGINQRNVDLVMGKNKRRFFPLVDDKLKTKSILADSSIPTAETIATCSSFFEMEEFLSSLQQRGTAFVIKPAQGFGGEGITVVQSIDQKGRWHAGSTVITPREQERYLAEILYGVYSMSGEGDIAFAEALIVSHADIAELSRDGLPDVRVIIHEGTPLAAMIRVPTSESGGKANLHAGGCAVGVDIHSGETISGWYRGRRITHHPESGAHLEGLQLPFWDRIIEISTAIYSYFPLGYMGADFALDAHRGPIILELNARPGLEIQNVCGLGMLDLINETGATHE
ncbi:MAG: sugar-transfer associated ATP-grasp domain-containing protein [Fibrobacterota bacterium]